MRIVINENKLFGAQQVVNVGPQIIPKLEDYVSVLAHTWIHVHTIVDDVSIPEPIHLSVGERGLVHQEGGIPVLLVPAFVDDTNAGGNKDSLGPHPVTGAG